MFYNFTVGAPRIGNSYPTGVGLSIENHTNNHEPDEDCNGIEGKLALLKSSTEDTF